MELLFVQKVKREAETFGFNAQTMVYEDLNKSRSKLIQQKLPEQL